MKKPNRLERRGQAARGRMLVKRRMRMVDLSIRLARAAEGGAFSRNEARRRLHRTMVASYGRTFCHQFLSPFLIARKELER